jgi:hypothetical protein
MVVILFPSFVSLMVDESLRRKKKLERAGRRRAGMDTAPNGLFVGTEKASFRF